MRTFHKELIKKIITHPQIYDLACDDGSPPREEYEPSMDDRIYYLLGDEGLMIYMPYNACTWQAHACILPQYWGKSHNFIKESISWMFRNTECRKIEARIPATNQRAYAQAKRVGFVGEGISSKSFLKDGELHDMYLMGVTWESER